MENNTTMTNIKNLNWQDMNAWGSEIPTEIKETGNKYQDKTHWKNAVKATILDNKEAQNFVAWINAFHGCAAEIKTIPVQVRHPEGIILFNMDAFEISSKGYSC